MIHRVSLPQQDGRLLRELVDLQIALLQVAIDTSDLSEASSPLEDSLTQHYSSRSKAKEAIRWLTRTKKNSSDLNDLFSNLCDFAAYDKTSDKRDFVANVEHDIALIDNPRQAKLQITIPGEPDAWKKAAKNFLLEFYTIFSRRSGFPSKIFINRKEKYRRWDFIDAFTAVNPDLRLCAVCDSTLYRTSFEDRPYTSIEHFFPKSLYPHLSIHPRNLIPICPNCNSGAAGTKDPLDKDEKGLLGLILPYQESSLYQQTFIAVLSEYKRNKHPLELEILPGREYPDSQIAIDNFEHIYSVQERWKEEMDWLSQHVFRRVTQFFMTDVQAGNKLRDINFLSDRLNVLMGIISSENLGQDPFGFASIWMIKHHIDSLKNTGENSPFYIALIDWAESQEDRWREYRKHAEIITKKVPHNN